MRGPQACASSLKRRSRFYVVSKFAGLIEDLVFTVSELQSALEGQP